MRIKLNGNTGRAKTVIKVIEKEEKKETKHSCRVKDVNQILKHLDNRLFRNKTGCNVG